MNESTMIQAKAHTGDHSQSDILNIQATRSANAAVKMMQTLHKGATALHKIQRETDQTITVKHVQVNNGG